MSVNRQQLEAMQKAGEALDPKSVESCRAFGDAVRKVESAIIHTYQLVASIAVKESDPGRAADAWRCMNEFCDEALAKLRDRKGAHPSCGTPELYDLTLDYKLAAQKRFMENIQDAEWLKKNPNPPNGLFQPTN